MARVRHANVRDSSGHGNITVCDWPAMYHAALNAQRTLLAAALLQHNCATLEYMTT